MTTRRRTLGPAWSLAAIACWAPGAVAQCNLTWDLSPGTPGLSNTVESAITFEDEVIVGGNFTMADDTLTFGVARWDGTDWNAMGAPPNPGLQGWVYALHEHAGVLFAGGTFTRSMNGLTMRRIGQWTGTDWAPVEGGTRGDFSGFVRAMATYNDQLVAAGDFALASDSPASCIARWDGARWLPLGDGLRLAPDDTRLLGVYATQVFEERLVVAGVFSLAGGNPALNVAAWNGTEWQPMGDGLEGIVYSLVVHEESLYAAGSAPNPNDMNRSYSLVARWNGAGWEHLEAGFYHEGSIRALASYSGKLYASADWRIEPGLGIWDGLTWSTCWPNWLFALAPSPFGLVVAGEFQRVPDTGAPVGRIVFGTPSACAADFNNDGVLNSQDYFDFLTAFFTAGPSADFNNDGAINSQDFFDFLAMFFAGC